MPVSDVTAGDVITEAWGDSVSTSVAALEAADVALDGRLDTAEASLTSLDGRLDTAEADIDALVTADTVLDGRLDTAEADIVALEAADVALDGRVDALEAAPASEWDATLTLAADQVVALSTTPTLLTGLAFTATAGKTYIVESVVIYSGDGGRDARINIGESGTLSGAYNAVGVGGGNATQTVNALTNVGNVTSWGADGANRRAAYFRAVHVGAGGSFEVRGAQNISGSPGVTFHAGSILRYKQID